MTRGLICWMVSHGNPKRSSTPGPKFSTSTSDVLSSSVKISVPCADFMLSVILRLLQLSMVKYRLSTFGISRSCPRVISPRPGGSSLMTSAPRKPSICVQDGPDCTCVMSRIRTPSRAFPMMNLLCGLVTMATSCKSLHVKTNQQYIAVLDSIVLALNSEFAYYAALRHLHTVHPRRD